MATYWWVGAAGPQAFNSSVNWSTTDAGSGGSGPPASGDTVIISRGYSQILGGDYSAIVLAAMFVSHAGSIGTANLPLKIGIANPASSGVVVSFVGNYGDSYLSPVCAGTNCIVQFNGTGNVWLSAATAKGTHIIGGGNVKVASDYTNSTAASFPIIQTGGTVAIDSGTSNAVNVDLQDGTIVSNRNVGVATVSYGGRLFVTGLATVASSTVNGGGVHFHQSSGTITLLVVKSGGAASDSGAKSPFVVTTSIGYGSAKIFTPGNPLIQYTNQSQIYGAPPGNELG